MANLTLIANPEDKQPRQNSVVTIADIMEAIDKAQAVHPEWFKPGQGWGAQPEEKTK